MQWYRAKKIKWYLVSELVVVGRIGRKSSCEEKIDKSFTTIFHELKSNLSSRGVYTVAL